LVIITRDDISNGYKSVQSTHSIAEFAYFFREEFEKWKQESNSIICLSVKNEQELLKLFNNFKDSTPTILFREPDVNNEITSICLLGKENVRKRLKHLPLLGNKKESFEDVIIKMIGTPQSKTQSVLDHGISVYKTFNTLIKSIKENIDLDLMIPEHLKCKELLNHLLDINIIHKYLIFHDIGKPYCMVWNEENNKYSFPDHANVSYKKYLEVSNDKNKVQISKLIKHDMDFHLLKPGDVEKYLIDSELNSNEIITLLFACLSELNSNAQMFGGYDSTSFKIKYKNFLKISKKILNLLEYEK
jgi:hypothetical protein